MNDKSQTVNQQETAKQFNKVWMVLILGALTAFGTLSMDMYLPGLPSVTDDFETSASLAQLSISATLVGLAIGQLVFGPLSDIVGRKRPLLITLSVYSVVSILAVFSGNIWMFISLRFIQGISGAAGIVIARAASRDMFTGKELTKFIAMLALVNGAAPILAPLLGGIVLNFASWRFVFVILFAIGVVMLISVLFTLPETLPVEDRMQGGLLETVRTFGILLKDHVFIGIALSQAFAYMSMFAYIAGSPFVLQNIYQVTPFTYSIIFAINGIGIIIAAQLTGKLAFKIDETYLLQWGVTTSFCGGLLLIISVLFNLPLFILLLAFFLVVSSLGIVNTTCFSLGMQRYDKMAGSASAFLGILPFAGGGLVSPLVGIAGDYTAVPMGIIIFITSTMALLVYHILVRHKRHPLTRGRSSAV